jgi:hypothetical protein
LKRELRAEFHARIDTIDSRSIAIEETLKQQKLPMAESKTKKDSFDLKEQKQEKDTEKETTKETTKEKPTDYRTLMHLLDEVLREHDVDCADDDFRETCVIAKLKSQESVRLRLKSFKTAGARLKCKHLEQVMEQVAMKFWNIKDEDCFYSSGAASVIVAIRANCLKKMCKMYPDQDWECNYFLQACLDKAYEVIKKWPVPLSAYAWVYGF